MQLFLAEVTILLVLQELLISYWLTKEQTHLYYKKLFAIIQLRLYQIISMKHIKNTSLAWFSIIEVLIAMFIFSLGLVSVYGLISSSLRVNNYNKHAIIASNLAREQIELVKNIRDTNYAKLKLWTALPNTWDLQTGYYKVFLENNNADIWLISSSSWDTSDITHNSTYKICLDTDKNYNYCDKITWDKTSTPYYKYLEVQETKDSSGNVIHDSYMIISKLVWYSYGQHEFEIKTLLSDWRRI